MKVLGSFKRVDRGLKKIKAIFKEVAANGAHVKAGVLGNGGKGDAKHDDKLTNAQLAVWLEFGTSSMPARPFIRPAFELNRTKYQALIRRLVAKELYKGQAGYERALAIVGQAMASDMKKYVTAGPQIPPPNAPSTLARKQAKTVTSGKAKGGEVRTLVDSGRLVGSITYAVVAGMGAPARKFTKGHQGDL